MTTKRIPAIPVLYFSTKTSLSQLGPLVGSVAQQLYKEAASQDLLPVGPVQWIYTGADGKPDTIFQLEIALPVNKLSDQLSSFQQKELPVFDCACILHEGAWENLSDSYNKIIGEVYASGNKMSGVVREQYIYMDFNQPENNITEILIGI